LGGHIRVGFENNICRPDGTPARDNAENVARIAAALRTQARKATP
ncbi:MAG: 3-keto-5-aminohexanoate cleavage protein, partial [Shimia sp.]|nr:3-keto-5-aminohexanoate cleavage protein [Shimia sp.]